jgi:hypothetical protein
MKIIILICIAILTQQIESDRFILNLHNIDGLPFLNIQLGDDKLKKNVLISTNSKISWIKTESDILENIKEVSLN